MLFSFEHKAIVLLFCVKMCRTHDGQPLSQYCHDCETVYCGSCSEHTDHRSELLTLSTVSPHLVELRNILTSSLEGPIMNLVDAASAVQTVDENLAVNYDTARQSVCDTFDVLMKCIEKRREASLMELDEVFRQKDKMLKNQASRCFHPVILS